MKERPKHNDNPLFIMWKQWVNFILGIAVIAMAYMGGDHTTRFVVAGALIAILALWAALGRKSSGGPMQSQ